MGEQVAARLKWGCSSVGRAPALQAGGQGFESLILHHRLGYKIGEIIFTQDFSWWRGTRMRTKEHTDVCD